MRWRPTSSLLCWTSCSREAGHCHKGKPDGLVWIGRSLKKQIFGYCKKPCSNGVDKEQVLEYIREFGGGQNCHELYRFVIEKLCHRFDEFPDDDGEKTKRLWLCDIISHHSNTCKCRGDVPADCPWLRCLSNNLVPRCLYKYAGILTWIRLKQSQAMSFHP